MPKLYAFHTIHRNPTGSKIEIVDPETVFSASDAEVKDLTKLNAVREATAQDIAMAKANGKYVAADDEDEADETPSPRTGRGKKSTSDV